MIGDNYFTQYVLMLPQVAFRWVCKVKGFKNI